MNIAGAIIVYLLLWWSIFFMVLPWNIKGSWENPETQIKGQDPGAPQDPQLWAKFKRTSWIAAIAWIVVAAILMSGIINFRD